MPCDAEAAGILKIAPGVSRLRPHDDMMYQLVKLIVFLLFNEDYTAC
jgi:hypothetical protein